MEEAPPPPPSRRLGKRRRHAEAERLDDDGVETPTSAEQRRVEEGVLAAYHKHEHALGSDGDTRPRPTLLRDRHAAYLTAGLRRLGAAHSGLDAIRPWLAYWILHGLELLGRPVRDDDTVASDVCRFLARCQSPRGGFGGGPGQLAHLAPTYAAVAALCTLGTPEAYDVVDRPRLLHFLRSMRSTCRRPEEDATGAFAMHAGGETDVRGVYCAAAVASLVFPSSSSFHGLFQGTAAWLGRCQSWEGGLGGAPGLEAHGGYSYCGAAAAVLLGSGQAGAPPLPGLDLDALLRWAVGRQTRCEGGFQGRCNKLVDGCYSFWQGALLAIIQHALGGGGGEDGGEDGEESDHSRDETDFVGESNLSRDKPVFSDESDLSGNNTAVFVEDESDLSRDKTVFVDETNLSTDKTAFLQDECNLSTDKTAFTEDETHLSTDKTVFLHNESKLSRHKAVSGGKSNSSRQRWLFDQQALQEYILLCCQDPDGGLVDKPGKERDFYHTCYCLSGLSVAQHSGSTDQTETVVGGEENRLARTHPVYNISPQKVARARQHFQRLPVIPASDPRQAPESTLTAAEDVLVVGDIIVGIVTRRIKA